MTLASRTGVVLAKTLTAADIGMVVERLLKQVADGKDVRGCAAELRAWLRLGLTIAEEEPDEDLPWASMTSAQRAVKRAQLLALAEAHAADTAAAAAEHEV